MKKTDGSKRLFNIYGYTGGNFGGNVYDTDYLSPTIINFSGGGNRQPLVQVTAAALRKRGDGQVLETSNREIANSITTIQKDSLVNENMRIRKLTPKECWRLMGFDDCDFDKARQVNSDTQLYKQAGNSIVVNVLTAIFGEMLPKAPEER